MDILFRRMAATALAVAAGISTSSVIAGEADWPGYGRTAGMDRHSPLKALTPATVGKLAIEWRFATGEAAETTAKKTRFEATPIVVGDRLFFPTALGRVFALDADSGKEIWRFDGHVPRHLRFGDFATRGVSYWGGGQRSAAVCSKRIFLATIDARLIALDANSGAVCDGFGRDGVVDLRQGLRNAPFETEEYAVTSPPAVVGDVLVVGSSVADNNRTDAASGEVRAFDARTGQLKWSWDPVAQDPADPAWKTWRGPVAHSTGGANVWTPISADPDLGLVFLATSSPSPDYFGGQRLGDNRNANSLVAIKVSTGKVAWTFQTVHHDVWDYDNASPPALIALRTSRGMVKAVALATKTGQLFVLDRRTGKPLFGVEERPAPASDVAGEETAASQPFSRLPQLSPNRVTPEEIAASGIPDAEACAAAAKALRNDGPFTPPSLKGSLILPGNVGGAHWGGVAFDPDLQILVVPTNRIAAVVELTPRAKFTDGFGNDDGRTSRESTNMRGTPYVMTRDFFTGPSGLPCTPPPWGALHAIDLKTGTTAWLAPIGSHPGAPRAFGGVNLGGVFTTAGGLTFATGGADRRLLAFETLTGRLLWDYELPGVARAAPMTWRGGDGRQRVGVAVGRRGDGEDELIVFALPRAAASLP